MNHRVTLTRTRKIEEKVIADVNASNPADAVSAALHLLNGNQIDWKYSKTIEVGQQVITIKEAKREAYMGGNQHNVAPTPVETPQPKEVQPTEPVKQVDVVPAAKQADGLGPAPVAANTDL